jgi:hypothetical protein
MLQADECAWERAAAGGEGEEQGEQDAAQAGAGASCSHRWYVTITRVADQDSAALNK